MKTIYTHNLHPDTPFTPGVRYVMRTDAPRDYRMALAIAFIGAFLAACIF